jgi:biopolymer transport protein ExbD
MKFPRNARIFQGRLDAAPFITVLFLLVLFVMLGTLVYTPGVRLELPAARDLPGTDKATIAVAIDRHGQLYFQNELMSEKRLLTRLQQAAHDSAEPLTLVVQGDKGVSYEMLVRLTMLAREAGIREAWLATLPQPFDRPARAK